MDGTHGSPSQQPCSQCIICLLHQTTPRQVLPLTVVPKIEMHIMLWDASLLSKASSVFCPLVCVHHSIWKCRSTFYSVYYTEHKPKNKKWRGSWEWSYWDAIMASLILSTCKGHLVKPFGKNRLKQTQKWDWLKTRRLTENTELCTNEFLLKKIFFLSLMNPQVISHIEWSQEAEAISCMTAKEYCQTTIKIGSIK